MCHVKQVIQAQSLCRMPSSFFLYVDDCDVWYRRAVAAGATPTEEPSDKPYGHRTAVIVDPFGYEWFPASLFGDATS
jgi:PhnB protein